MPILCFTCWFDFVETIGFKIPNLDVDKSEGPRMIALVWFRFGVSCLIRLMRVVYPCVPSDKLLTHWDDERNVFTLQFYFKPEAPGSQQPATAF